jgi:hypothetical protein
LRFGEQSTLGIEGFKVLGAGLTRAQRSQSAPGVSPLISITSFFHLPVRLTYFNLAGGSPSKTQVRRISASPVWRFITIAELVAMIFDIDHREARLNRAGTNWICHFSIARLAIGVYVIDKGDPL